MLALQERLLEVPPSRCVDRGAAWYGVDPSTKQVAIAWTDGNDRQVTSVLIPRNLDPIVRLAHTYNAVRDVCADLVRTGPAPGIVLVEQPSGRTSNPPLLYAVGVIQAAIYDGFTQALGWPVLVETVTSSSWKSLACGSGAIKKPDLTGLKGDERLAAYDSYEVLRWARAHGYAGSSWDEADAFGIAEAARQLVAITHAG